MEGTGSVGTLSRVSTPGEGGSRFRKSLSLRRLPALDGLRAIAVLVVIVGHRGYPFRVPSDLGVSAFFVLSGFLITRLLLREEEATGSISLKNFYARRTMRIFPAYYAFLAVSYALDRLHGTRWSPALAISAVTYTVNYFNAFHHHPSNAISHAWSLGVEEQFYLMWPLVLMLCARRGRRWMIGAAAFGASATIVWRATLVANGVGVAYLYNAFDTRFDNLAVGCLLALVADYEAAELVMGRLARRVWYPLVTLGLLAVSRVGTPEWYHYSAGFTIDALLLAIFIVQMLQVYATPLWSWLEHPVARYLGIISYPMYLYHQWGDSVGRHVSSSEGPAFVAGLAATIALASGSYYVIERPFLKLKARFEAKTTYQVDDRQVLTPITEPRGEQLASAQASPT